MGKKRIGTVELLKEKRGKRGLYVRVRGWEVKVDGGETDRNGGALEGEE